MNEFIMCLLISSFFVAGISIGFYLYNFKRKWRDMDSAPRDGRTILVKNKYPTHKHDIVVKAVRFMCFNTDNGGRFMEQDRDMTHVKDDYLPYLEWTELPYDKE